MVHGALRYHVHPELDDPVLVLAFAGWNDASEAATGAVQYINDELRAVPLAEVDPEDFYDFQTRIGEDFKDSWSPERRAATEKILAARGALYDLRLHSGTRGNWLRIARLFGKFAAYPYLLSSPMVWGEVLRALERDVKMDPWLRPVKKQARDEADD